MQGSRLRPKWSHLQPFFESVRVKIWSGRTCASAWSVLLQSVCFIQRALPAAAHCSRSQISLITWREALFFSVGRAWFILAASARARRCAQRTEHDGVFGFQTKVKDRSLNQRRWTCWYSCRKKNMQVLSATASLVLLFFCFHFEKLIFAVYLTLRYGGVP